MERGYTLIWRKAWDNPVLQERGKRFSRFEAWIYITNKMARGTDDPESGLQRGEFEASLRFMARAWNWSLSAVYRFIQDLTRTSMIKKVKRWSEHFVEHQAERFIVCNYDTYNPTRNADRNTLWNADRNKLNKDKRSIKEREIKPTSAIASSQAISLAQRLREKITARDPRARASRLSESGLISWALDIDKIIRIDGRTVEDCTAVIDWCQSDSFWAVNIMSGKKLRDKFDTLFGKMNASRPESKTEDTDDSWLYKS